MRTSAWRSAVVLGAFFAGASTAPARAGFVEDVVFALGYANFDVVGQHNVLSGGVDVSVSNNFLGNPLDFGSAELRMQGPISLELSAGGRFVPQLEVSFQTATSSTRTSTPLNYLWDIDVGGQQSQIAGNLLVDGSLWVNKFGFYELDLEYSSRQTVTNEGRFANDETDYDFDVGPVTIRGNIFADLLAVLTDPIFEATNSVNIFASFSGRAGVQKALKDAAEDALDRLAQGNTFDIDNGLISPIALGVVRGDIDPSLPLTQAQTRAVTPEPTVMLLMLLGAPLLVFRRRFRRRVAR